MYPIEVDVHIVKNAFINVSSSRLYGLACYEEGPAAWEKVVVYGRLFDARVLVHSLPETRLGALFGTNAARNAPPRSRGVSSRAAVQPAEWYTIHVLRVVKQKFYHLIQRPVVMRRQLVAVDKQDAAWKVVVAVDYETKVLVCFVTATYGFHLLTLASTDVNLQWATRINIGQPIDVCVARGNKNGCAFALRHVLIPYSSLFFVYNPFPTDAALACVITFPLQAHTLVKPYVYEVLAVRAA